MNGARPRTARRATAHPIVPAGLAALALTLGCGGGASEKPATCEEAAQHLAQLEGHGGERFASRRVDHAHTCQEARWSDATRTCVARAADLEAATACHRPRPGGGGGGGGARDYANRSKESQATLQLRRLEKAAHTAFLIDGTYPAGTAPLTPTTPCCEGPGGKCPATATDWEHPVWRALAFSVDEPSYYRFTYASEDGREAMMTAVGDLDCDGEVTTYKIVCAIIDAQPSCLTESPPRPD